MKLTTLIAAYLAALPKGTTLSNKDLEELLPDTPRKTASRSRTKATLTGFVEYKGFRDKGISPSYRVTGSWTGSDNDYESLELISDEEASEKGGEVRKVPESYKPFPEAGSAFESGLYRFAPSDNIEGIRDSLPKMLPVVSIKTRGIANWEKGFEKGFYLMECNGKRKVDEIHIDQALSTNHASLIAALNAIQSLKKSCIIVWQTTTAIFKLTGKNQQLCEDLKACIEDNKHIVFWQESELTGQAFISLFDPEKETA